MMLQKNSTEQHANPYCHTGRKMRVDIAAPGQSGWADALVYVTVLNSSTQAVIVDFPDRKSVKLALVGVFAVRIAWDRNGVRLATPSSTPKYDSPNGVTNGFVLCRGNARAYFETESYESTQRWMDALRLRGCIMQDFLIAYRAVRFIGDTDLVVERASADPCSEKADEFMMRLEERVPGVYPEEMRKEVLALGALRHPGIMSTNGVYAVQVKGAPYWGMITDYRCGMTLTECLYEGSTHIDTRQILTLICQPLAYMHERGAVHLKLNTDAIMVSQGTDPTIKLRNFGNSVSVENELPSSHQFPGYLAPEMVAGGRYTEKIDSFCLGIIFHELLCLSRPKLTNSDDGRITNCAVSQCVKGLSESAQKLLSLLLEMDPTKRISVQQMFSNEYICGERLCASTYGHSEYYVGGGQASVRTRSSSTDTDARLLFRGDDEGGGDTTASSGSGKSPFSKNPHSLKEKFCMSTYDTKSFTSSAHDEQDSIFDAAQSEASEDPCEWSEVPDVSREGIDCFRQQEPEEPFHEDPEGSDDIRGDSEENDNRSAQFNSETPVGSRKASKTKCVEDAIDKYQRKYAIDREVSKGSESMPSIVSHDYGTDELQLGDENYARTREDVHGSVGQQFHHGTVEMQQRVRASVEQHRHHRDVELQKHDDGLVDQYTRDVDMQERDEEVSRQDSRLEDVKIQENICDHILTSPEGTKAVSSPKDKRDRFEDRFVDMSKFPSQPLGLDRGVSEPGHLMRPVQPPKSAPEARTSEKEEMPRLALDMVSLPTTPEKALGNKKRPTYKRPLLSCPGMTADTVRSVSAPQLQIPKVDLGDIVYLPLRLSGGRKKEVEGN